MRNVVTPLLLAGLMALACISPALAQTPDPVAVLQSNASLREKSEACRALALTGGKEAVPALAALLTDEKMSHFARMALEPMPCSEAGDALRAALDATTGALRIGMIGSVAARKDEQAVPSLVALLSDGDAEVAQAAARALGKIASPKAADALEDAVAQADVPPLLLLARCDGLLACAESLVAKGKEKKAAALYEAVRGVEKAPAQVKAAALRGAALSLGPEEGLPVLIEGLKAEDWNLADAALRAARELGGGDQVSAGLAAALPDLTDERKCLLLSVLGYRGGQAAGQAMLAQAESGSTVVRAAAIKALTQIGFEPAVAVIQGLVSSDDADLSKVARESLSYFPGQAGDAAISAMLASDQAPVRTIAVELISKGGLEKPVAVLLGAAKSDADESVRAAALDALRDQIGANELPDVLDLLVSARSQAEIQAAESVLSALCQREKDRTGGEIVIQKAEYGVLPGGPKADVAAKVKEFADSGAGSVSASNGVFGDTAPGKVKQLQVVFTENGVTVDRTVKEGESLRLSASATPPAVVEPLCAAFESAPTPAKAALIRILGTTASPKALETVKAAASSSEPEIKQTAEQILGKWQG
ncbi:MAG: HEAT repeat domain-containing protein [Candidatus Hydrogenedentes bacterium]|nr:HEAT repeat domain-containing protein [Candidatus Hydrogenedentota bacterium]